MNKPEITVQSDADEKKTKSEQTKSAITRKAGGCMAVRPGELCPACGEGIMNYNRLLILSCALCGFSEPGGGFT